jgi:hypothetical protein
MVVPVTVSGREPPEIAAWTFAIPKSNTLSHSPKCSRWTRKRLSGFRSRWTMPLSWAGSNASQSWMISPTAREGSSFLSLFSERWIAPRRPDTP